VAAAHARGPRQRATHAVDLRNRLDQDGALHDASQREATAALEDSDEGLPLATEVWQLFRRRPAGQDQSVSDGLCTGGA
ncbi:MAG: hypothetical protein ACRDVG_09310, partial [Jatrophihabitantaceae bacterium]